VSATTKPWPRLSESLDGPIDPVHCQKCGASGEEVDLARWIEHDENDRPERILVVLCRTCSDAIIEPHPRLYDRLEHNAPWPGCMNICYDCCFREGYKCTHPDLTLNGGTGLKMVVAKPQVMFLDGTRGGKRAGWQQRTYGFAPCDCVGRKEMSC
jgi:hypothetical protein